MSQVIVYLVVELSRKLLRLLKLPDRSMTSLKRKSEDEPFAGRKPPSLRTRPPSPGNVEENLAQSIAVLTSGGDAQGKRTRSILC